MQPLAFELTGAVIGAVVYEVIAFAKVFAMGDDHALVEDVVKVFCYPRHFVGPR